MAEQDNSGLYNEYRKLRQFYTKLCCLVLEGSPRQRGRNIVPLTVMEEKMTNENVTWNSDTIYALGLYKLITSILGIWPLRCQDVFSKIRVIILALLQITMMISLIAGIECSTLNSVVEMISLIQCTILSLVKVIVLRCFRSKMFEIISSAVNDWANVKTSRARSIMREHAKTGRSVCIFQMISAYVTTIPLIIGALPFLMPRVNVTETNISEIEAPRVLPLPTTCIFGDNLSDSFYAIVFIIQSIQLLATCTANIGNDVYFFGITMHLCGQFQLLGEDLENFDTSMDDEKERENLVELVKRHVRLSQLAQYLEDSFNFIILVEVSANALQMCLMGIQMILSLKSGDKVVVINTIIILYVLSLQLYLYSYAGDRLSSQIAKLGISAYFSPWYEMPPRLARDIFFMIMRNHKSFNITAGKVYRMDIDNFKNLIKALGSYFSVLRIMFDT